MKLTPIKSNREYFNMIIWAEGMMYKNVKPNSTTGQKLRIALKLIKQYEDVYSAILNK